jgi:peptidoglycan/LPS O-acetylase OafA/YrhL
MSNNQQNSFRIPALDGVRGIATLTVLVGHFMFYDIYHDQWWWALAHGGWLGVDLFFVLSGFLITGILLHKKGNSNYFSDFYRRRVLRILPLYYFAIILSFIAIVFIDREPFRLYTGYDGLGWFLAFIPNVALALKNDWLWQTNWVGLSHLWSLAVEEQFYLIWPLVVLFIPKRILAVVCVFLLFIGYYIRIETDIAFGQEWSIASYVLPYCHMDGLAGGSLMAILVNLGWINYRPLQKQIVADLTFGCGILVLYLLVAGNTHWRGEAAALLFMGMLYLAMSPSSSIRRLCEIPILIHIGTFSYGMYVFHQMFRMIFEWYLRRPLMATGLPVWLVQIIYVVVCVLISYLLARLSWKYIEERFIKMK